ncbi:hypothetical protein [Paenibacillus donghaensis]|uniref:Secreted protein n=1 Tax=Paenibacillus donghaensis TaxID=414771 RepID=A0A2Z2KQS6_9BACL|nr:hypothetical protein [Paenibacillus donghaensis]ASA23732.1 hypothetical protein B9T62_24840 [Paenibacillus donghaensis]
MIITKRVKTIGVSAMALMVVASMSTAAFAASNDKNEIEKHPAIGAPGDAIQVYDIEKNEYVNPDTIEDFGESVEAVPAVKAK